MSLTPSNLRFPAVACAVAWDLAAFMGAKVRKRFGFQGGKTKKSRHR
jgi:hypothetical protein